MTVRRGKDKGKPIAKLREETRMRLALLGRERALIYKTMVLTGLRKAELASITVGQVHLAGSMPYLELAAADEKNREGSQIPLRDNLAADIEQWIAHKQKALYTIAINCQCSQESLTATEPLFYVPTGLIRILDRDLKAAGIPKRDERGRTIDVHAMRHTFGTLLSKGGVAPRTAQAALRHSSINLTMNTYTDPKLLDVHGALESLPALPLDGEQQFTREYLTATGTDDSRPAQLAPVLAPNSGHRGQAVSSGDAFDEDTTDESALLSVALTADADNGTDPLTTPVNESFKWAMRDSN